MRRLSVFSLLWLAVVAAAGPANAQSTEPVPPNPAPPPDAYVSDSETIPTLRKVGSRGFYVLEGMFAEFDPDHPSVEIWTPDDRPDAPVMVYAHGGAGFRDDDRARVEMFRRNGFATISFDSYEMNGFDDWNFVTRRVANSGKQQMIWGVYKGAVAYAAKSARWNGRNIVLYGGSNGARVVLYAGSAIQNERIRAIIAEAPAGSGFALGDYDIPTIIPFGALDTWAGKSDADYVWQRTYPGSPISIEHWVRERQAIQRPIRFIFYENAGHLFFEGPLERVTVRRGDRVAFTAFQGAADGVLEQYEKDLMAFVDAHVTR
ncbi:MAG: hypothetical protein AAFX44_07625 [Pseudomonadota bacterium]